jgi:hypothetical protein
MEHDGLSLFRSPILVEDLDPIAGCHERHVSPFITANYVCELSDLELSTGSFSSLLWSTTHRLWRI